MTAFDLFVISRPRIYRQVDHCAANLRNIGLACQIYANEHDGKFPDSFEALLQTGDIMPDYLICRGSNDTEAPGASSAEWASHLSEGGHVSYVYVGKGLTQSVPNPQSVVVAYEPLGNHPGEGTNFVFADGRVRRLDDKKAKALIAAIPTTRPTTAP